MKEEIDKVQNVGNYSIKDKHMGTMTSFFAAKNFELQIKMPNASQPDNKQQQ